MNQRIELTNRTTERMNKTMNRKISKQEAIDNARRDFKQFVIWLNVTHPRYTAGFIANRNFSVNLMNQKLDLFFKWKHADSEFKRLHAREYSECTKAVNYGFGVPDGLKEKVLGTYKDENGKQHRIGMSDIGIDPLANHFELDGLQVTHWHDGRKKDFNTGLHKYSWTEKYMLNPDVRMEFLKKPEYSRHETFPEMSSRLHRILRNWIQANKKKRPASGSVHSTSILQPTEIKVEFVQKKIHQKTDDLGQKKVDDNIPVQKPNNETKHKVVQYSMKTSLEHGFITPEEFVLTWENYTGIEFGGKTEVLDQLYRTSNQDVRIRNGIIDKMLVDLRYVGVRNGNPVYDLIASKRTDV